VPLDVHMGRLCRILGLHHDKTISLSTALKVTKAFAQMNPDDPAKYDFALSRIGILEDCRGRRRTECEACELYEICLRRNGWHRDRTGSTVVSQPDI
jgi:endonuclease III